MPKQLRTKEQREVAAASIMADRHCERIETVAEYEDVARKLIHKDGVHPDVKGLATAVVYIAAAFRHEMSEKYEYQ